MPIYEFVCGKCEAESEILVPRSDWKGTQCPSCGSTRLEKKLSVFAAANSEGEAMPECTGQPSACGRCALN